MHGEFALQHEARYYRRFKRVHYGCCEPLHHKVDVCARHLPNMYQISMSPWVDFAVGARNVGRRFIFGWRPNPSFLAMERWDPDLVRRDLTEKLAIARMQGCTVAIYLKDISTVRHEPWRLTEWERIAKEMRERLTQPGSKKVSKYLRVSRVEVEHEYRNHPLSLHRCKGSRLGRRLP